MSLTSQGSRPNDFLYDPAFITSGKKDYYKAAMKANMAATSFTPSPIFPSMFSSLPHRPSQQYIMRYNKRIPDFIDQSYETKKLQTHNSNCSNITANIINYIAQPNLKKMHDVTVVDLNSSPDMPNTYADREMVGGTRTIDCQTQFRESSAQTSPWAPDYKIMESSDLEILKLDFLKWGSGLPAGMHEITIIDRARMKMRWKECLPEATTPAELEERREFLIALETDEWKFREQEIEDIQLLRLELLEKLLQELHDKTKNRAERKMRNFTELKQKEKEEKLDKLRKATEREMRKLEQRHKGKNPKYHEVDVLTEHKDYTSELYAPLMRHGQHPKRGDEVIYPGFKGITAEYEGIEKISTLPKWTDKMEKIEPVMKYRTLCPRETKWSDPVLKNLHEELKNLRKHCTYKCTLRVRIEPEKPPPRTPEVEGVSQSVEELHLAAILIESVLRGRAAQMIIFEGRDTCRELIQELRSTHGLLNADKTDRIQERNDSYQKQSDDLMLRNQAAQLKEALDKIQGSIIGTLMDFLNKELRRLLTERKAHALCLIAERERLKREAAEAGRRQMEVRRRAEHDEMFKQVVKIHQETVDVYLLDIIREGMENISDLEAKHYVMELAKKIDADAYSFQRSRPGILEQEELVADLVHHFVLPEVEKELARTRIKLRQQKHLRNAHELIYSTMEFVPARAEDVEQANEMAMNILYPVIPETSDGKSGPTYDDTISIKSASGRMAVKQLSGLQPQMAGTASIGEKGGNEEAWSYVSSVKDFLPPPPAVATKTNSFTSQVNSVFYGEKEMYQDASNAVENYAEETGQELYNINEESVEIELNEEDLETNGEQDEEGEITNELNYD